MNSEFEEKDQGTSEEANDAMLVQKENIIYCTKCGKQNRADSAFCGYCGNPFNTLYFDSGINNGLTKEDIDLAYYRADIQMKQEALRVQQEALEQARIQAERQSEQLKLQREQFQSMMRCPRCGSTSLSGNKKGYGIGLSIAKSIIEVNKGKIMAFVNEEKMVCFRIILPKGKNF